MAIKENHKEELLSIDLNWNTLEVYENDAPTGEDATTRMDNDMIYDATYEEGANETHEEGSNATFCTQCGYVHPR